MELNKYSKIITQDETQPASQAMLYGIGLTEEEVAVKISPYNRIQQVRCQQTLD
jgi:hypothetical protein